MAISHLASGLHSPAIATHLLGLVPYADCLALQQRLVYEIGGRQDGRIAMLLCEHPGVITIGRGGSAAHVERESGLVARGQIGVRWVNRGGGCLLHAPGQLAIYPIVPLAWHGLSPGDYLDRFQGAILRALAELGIGGRTLPGRHGIWGRTGQLAAFGVAVRNWVSYYGAWINVCPSLGLFRLVESDPRGHTRMSSLVAERGPAAKMTSVRAAVIRQLSEALGCERYHLYTGHPLLRRVSEFRVPTSELA